MEPKEPINNPEAPKQPITNPPQNIEPQPNQQLSPQQPLTQAVTNNNQKQSNKKVIIIVIIIVASFLLAGIGYVGYRVLNQQKSNDNTTESISSTSGEAKADAYISAIKNSQPLDLDNLESFELTDEEEEILDEIEKYANIIEKPDLTNEERMSEAAKIVGTMSQYTDTIVEGEIHKISSKSTGSNPDAVETKYRLENKNATAFRGPFMVTVTTAYLDGDWRAVNFTVSED